MWFEIWILARRIILGDVFQPPTPLVKFGIFNFRLFSENVCFSVCLYIPLFLKEIQYIVWKLCRDFLRVLSWGYKCIKLFSTVTLPRRAVLRYFLPIFLYRYFFMFLYFLRTIQLLHINFYTDILGITQSVTSIKKPFCSIDPSAESHFEVFWGMLFYSWELLLILSYKIMYRCFLY